MIKKYLWLFCLLPYWGNAQQLDTALINNYLERAQILADSFYHNAAAEYGEKILKEYEAAGIHTIDSAQVRACQWVAYEYLYGLKLEAASIYLQRGNEGVQTLGMDSTLLGAEQQIVNSFLLTVNGKYSESIQAYHRVIQLLQKHLPSNHRRIADVYRLIGNVYGRLSKTDQAVTYYEKSLRLYRETIAKDDHRMAKVYSVLGQCHIVKTAYREALRYLEKALKIQLEVYGEYHVETGATYHRISTVFNYLGAFAKATSFFEKHGEILQKTAASPGQLIMYYGRLGVAYMQQNNFERGQFYLERAVEISQQEFDGNHFFLIPALNYLGIVYILTDRPDQAFLTCQKALAKDVTKKYLVWTYGNLALVYKMKKDYEKAGEYLEKILELSLQTDELDPQEMARRYRGIAENYSKLDQFDKAVAYVKKALAIVIKASGEEHAEVAHTYRTLGEVYAGHNQYDLALKAYNRSIKIYGFNPRHHVDFSKIGQPVFLQEVLLQKINVYQSLYQQGLTQYEDTISNSFDQLLALQEHVYQEMPEHDYHPEFVKVQFPIAEQAIHFYLGRGETGDVERAFQIAELNKSRQLQTHIRLQSVKQNIAGIPDSLLAQEYDLNIDIAYYDKLHFEVAAKPIPDQAVMDQYKEKLFDLREKRSKLLDQFKQDYPDYYRFRHSNEIPSISSLQKVMEEDQAVVEYFTGDSSIFVFVIGKDFVRAKTIKRDFPLNQLIEELRSGIYEYWMLPDEQEGLGYEESKDRYQTAAVELYDHLVGPVAAWLPEKLILIPDGPLCFIPFDALLTEKPQQDNYNEYPYLLRRHQISYNYSATFYNYALDRLPSRAQHSLLSLAPSFSGSDRQFRSLAAIREGHGALPNNGFEAETIAALFDGEVLSGQQATKQRFIELASNYKILHLATHSKSNDVQGDFSYIAFQSAGDTTGQESRLYAQELYHLHLDAEMVVLSACESGLGELKRGEGITGMASAFAYAGAKSTITSLWSVSDLETSRLMEKFYTNLQTGMEKDAALRRAKLDYLEQNERTAPFFWASFIPVGDMQPLVLPNKGLKWWVLIGGILLSLLFISRARKPAES